MVRGKRKEKQQKRFRLLRHENEFFCSSMGVYFSAQAVTKFTYDIGFGVELSGEYSPQQSSLGIKFILFFSGSYRGPKKNYNPHVRAENKR